MPFEAGDYTATVDGITASVSVVNDYGGYPIIQAVTLDTDAQARDTWGTLDLTEADEAFDGERFTGFANLLRTDEEGTGGDTAPEEGSVPETGADNASVPQTVQNMERNDEAAPPPAQIRMKRMCPRRRPVRMKTPRFRKGQRRILHHRLSDSNPQPPG